MRCVHKRAPRSRRTATVICSWIHGHLSERGVPESTFCCTPSKQHRVNDARSRATLYMDRTRGSPPCDGVYSLTNLESIGIEAYRVILAEDWSFVYQNCFAYDAWNIAGQSSQRGHLMSSVWAIIIYRGSVTKIYTIRNFLSHLNWFVRVGYYACACDANYKTLRC